MRKAARSAMHSPSGIPSQDPTRAKCELALEVLTRTGSVQLRVTGSSMLPTVWPGDLVTVQQTSIGQLQPGTLVIFALRCGFVIHRVVENTGDLLITRGDRTGRNDPPIAPHQILGHVVAVRRGRKVISPGGTLNCFQKTLALLSRRSSLFTTFLLCLNGLRRRLTALSLRSDAFQSASSPAIPLA